jgi:hypothetical protein
MLKQPNNKKKISMEEEIVKYSHLCQLIRLYEKQLISTCHLPTITKLNGVLLPKFIIPLRFNGTILQKQSMK